MDLIQPVGHFFSDAGTDVHDFFNAQFQKMVSNTPGAGSFLNGMNAPGNSAESVPDAAGNLFQTLAQGGNINPQGQDQGLAYGLGHDLGAAFGVGHQIGRGLAGNALQGIESMPNSLSMGAIQQNPPTFDQALQTPVLGGLGTALLDPTTWIGSGVGGKLLRGGADAAKMLPGLAESNILDGASQLGAKWSASSTDTSAFWGQATKDVMTSLPKAVMQNTPFLKEVIAPSTRAAQLNAELGIKSVASPVLLNTDALTAGPVIKKIMMPGADLTPEEQLLGDTLHRFVQLGKDPEARAAGFNFGRPNSVQPRDASIFAEPDLRDLMDMTPENAVQAMGQWASKEATAGLFMKNLQNDVAKASLLHQTAIPAMDALFNAWRTNVTHWATGLAAWSINTPMMTVHLLSERMIEMVANGLGPGSMGDRDFLFWHQAANGADPQILTEAQHSLDSLTNAQATAKETYRLPLVSTGLGWLQKKLPDMHAQSFFKDIADRVDHGVGLSAYQQLHWQKVQPILESLAEQHPELRGILDHMYQAPGTAVTGLAPEMRNVQGMASWIGDPAGLRRLANFMEQRPVLKDDVNTLMSRFTRTSPSMPAVVHDAVKDYMTSNGRQTLADLGKTIKTEQMNWVMSNYAAQPETWGKATDVFLNTVKDNPDWVRADPKAAANLANDLVQRYSQIPYEINRLAQRQVWSRIAPSVRSDIWGTAQKLIDRHINENGPLLDQLTSTIKGTFGSTSRFPALDQMMENLGKQAKVTRDAWGEYNDMLKAHGGPPRGGTDKYDAWWNQRVSKGDAIWGKHDLEQSALQKGTDWDKLQTDLQVFGKQYVNQQSDAARADALKAFQTVGDYAKGKTPNFERMANDDVGKFMNDLNSTIVQHTNKNFAQPMADHMRQMADMVDTLSPEVQQQLKDGVKKAYDLTNKQYYTMFVDQAASHSKFDEAMRAAGWPFWSYQSQRLNRLGSLLVSHPGMTANYVNYYNSTDAGYIPMGNWPIQWNYGKFGMQRTLDNVMSAGKGISNWLASGKSYGDAATQNALPHSDIKNPIMGTLDLAARYYDILGFGSSPIAPSTVATDIATAAQGDRPDFSGAVPGIAKLPGSLAATVGTQEWIPPSLRTALDQFTPIGAIYNVNRAWANLLGDKNFTYYRNQALAMQGIDWRNASQAQIDQAEHSVMAWQTASELSGAVSYRPQFTDVRNQAEAVAAKFGVPQSVIDSNDFKRNPTSVLYATKPDGSKYLNNQQLALIYQDHPEWHAWQEAAFPLMNTEQRAVSDTRSQLITGEQQMLEAIQNRPQIQQQAQMAIDGKISGKNLRDLMSGLNTERQAVNAGFSTLWSNLPQSQQIETPEDEAAQRYYGVDPQNFIDETTGNIDWSSFNTARQHVLDNMNTEQQEYVLNRYDPASRWTDPKLKMIATAQKAANDTLADYWTLGDKMWSQFQQQTPALAQFNSYADFKAALMNAAREKGVDPSLVFQNNGVIKQYSQQLSNNERLYRQVAPEVDLALGSWYDNKLVYPGLEQIIGQYGAVKIFTGGIVNQIAEAGARRRAQLPQFQPQNQPK